MAAGFVIPVDPREMAARFPSEDVDDDFDLEGFGVEELTTFLSPSSYQEQIEPLLDRIPEREADLIWLYFIQKKRQADIAEIFGVTQAAISYRLVRGIQRIKFLLANFCKKSPKSLYECLYFIPRPRLLE